MAANTRDGPRYLFACLLTWAAYSHPLPAMAQGPPEAQRQADPSAHGATPPRRPATAHACPASFNLPALPLEPVKSGVNRTLTAVERHKVYEKTRWLYRQLTDRGIYPRLLPLGEGSGFGAGLEYRQTLARNQPLFDSLGGSIWSTGTISGYQEHGGRLRFEELFGWPLELSGEARYQDRTEEDFFGLGPDSSEGSSSSFGQETTSLHVTLGQRLTEAIDWNFTFGYANTNISEGRDEGKVDLINLFTESTLPGVDGAELLSFRLAAEHDTRDEPDDPQHGGYERFSFAYVEGVNSADVGFFRYRAEAARFFPIGSPRRILALRAVAEVNDEVNGRPIPFFELTKLGGSRSLRGFQRNRFFGEGGLFFNAEYRYNVWTYKKLAMDTALFFDGGNVFEEIRDYQLNDFQPSYGAGIRIKSGRKVVLSFDTGHSDDGTEHFLRFGLPF